MERQSESQTEGLNITFSGEVWYWRGPAPFYFLSIPEDQSKEIKALSHLVTYGWGMIPVQAQIGKTAFTTSLFFKNGLYVLPIKDRVRRAEGVEEGEQAIAHIQILLQAR